LSGETLRWTGVWRGPEEGMVLTLLFNLVVYEIAFGFNDGDYYTGGYSNNIGYLVTGKCIRSVRNSSRHSPAVVQ
jgi:hypothetical protein